MKPIVLSLFDHSGNWSEPYKKAGYTVIRIDIQDGIDIMTWDYRYIDKELVYVILAAVPCTDFALSGGRYFKKKDADGTTQKSIALVKKTLEIINYFDPVYWCIENPMSRIHKLVPELGQPVYKFDPCDFAGYSGEQEAYNKKTWLWGDFNLPLKKRIEPLIKECPMHLKYGGKSLRTKNMRSITPKGFAQAFFERNNMKSM